MSQSERAEGRRYELKQVIMSDLKNSTRLIELLDQADTDEDPQDLIVPAWVARRWFDDDGPIRPPEVLLMVSFVSSSSERDNMIEESTYSTQIEIDFSARVAQSLRRGWIDELLDEVDAVMTRHSEAWIADGKTGLTDEPQWNTDRNRYMTVERYDIIRRT